MKRTLSLVIMAAALLLTQCRKPEVKFPSPVAPEGTTVSMTVTAGPGSKTDINGTTGAITWSANDKIYVGDGSKYVGYLSITDGVGEATGKFTGDVTLTDITEGISHTFHFYYLGSSDYTGILASGTSETVDVDFSSQDIQADGRGNLTLTNASKHHVGYGKANATVVAGQPITGLQVSMKSKVAIAYFCFQQGEGESANSYTGAITLRGDNICNKMKVFFNSADFDFSGEKGDISLAGGRCERYAMLVPAGTSAATLNFGGGASGTTTLENGIEANKFYRIDGNKPIVVKVKVPFTVDGSGTTVEFSPGNLQYLGKSDGPGTWRFAENQWDYMGDGPNSGTANKGNVDLTSLGYTTGMYNTGSGIAGPDETTEDMAAARDLFGWGATGFQDTRSDAHTYQTNYRPYSTSKTSVSGGEGINDYGYGPDYYSESKYKLTVENKSDWGCVEGLPSAGEGKTWRTLSKDEWGWLLGPSSNPAPGGNCRESSTIGETANARYAEVKVNDVCGLMVFPDVFAWPSDVSTQPSTFNSKSENWNDVNYTTADFEKLESAGVVFLPAAGYREGSSLSYVGSYVRYWSSTHNSSNSSKSAYNIYFKSTSVSSQSSSSRYYGYSVRLVR